MRWRRVALRVLCAAAACCAAGVGQVERRATLTGAVRLGALFAVHGAPAAARAGARCGAVREHYGIQRVEATLRALDDINADSALLAGLRLGAELRDSCWAPATALRQTIELVRDAIAPQVPQQAATAHATQCPLTQKATGGEGPSASPLLGVLGPGASSAAVQVQNLLQLFSIPQSIALVPAVYSYYRQVSYSATSRELSDRARFSTFFRVVPSDLHQARLLVAVLRAHNWTYVHAVHTDESYGQSGMALFRAEAARGGVCVARSEPLRAAPAPADVDAAVARLHDTRGPGVAVCWCEGRTARALLAGIARRGDSLRLVASDGWADRRDVPEGLEETARGALTLRIRSPPLADFDKHYHALSPHNNSRNPWFREFWEQKFNCSLENDPPERVRQCTGNESLATNYTQEPKLGLVVRGVYALAHALHDMIAAECGGVTAGDRKGGLCPALLPFNVSLYKRYLARVRFRAPDGGLVAFDDNGDPPPELSEYDVMSFEGSAARGWRYVRVGRWRSGKLRLKGGQKAAARRALGINAACGAACGAGQWARRAAARCCWTCVQCAPLAITREHSGCRVCPPGHRPDKRRLVCLASPIEWGEGRGAGWARLAARVAGGGGLLIAAVIAVVLWTHRGTPVVKSASRELCALLLASAAACHCAALAGAARPSPASCVLARGAAPALAGVYAAVLARTVRIARLVALSRAPHSRARLLSSRAQLYTWLVLSLPGLSGAVWAARVWGWAPRLLHPGRARSVLACAGQRALAQLVPLAPALLLLLACVALALKTRHLPHNFNEARHVGAAAYATCVIWAAFLPVYAYLGAETRAAALSACASGSSGACVLLSLAPRAFVCACRPQLNTRAHFLTASIRCHVGKYRPDAGTPHKNLPTIRDASSQTASEASRTGALDARVHAPLDTCTAAGSCARVTRTTTQHDDTVLIVLLHHTHTRPQYCDYVAEL